MPDNEMTRFSVTLSRVADYQFQVDFDETGVPPLLLDEPPPLGEAQGPNAARLVAAAVGNCLAASLLFCLEKARVPLESLRVRVRGSYVRNQAGRLRLGPLQVILEPETGEEHIARLFRCENLFEDFCVVTQSLREGLDVEVKVATPVAVDLAAAEI
jgi:uncharacterized OsmC-like protein